MVERDWSRRLDDVGPLTSEVARRVWDHAVLHGVPNFIYLSLGDLVDRSDALHDEMLAHYIRDSARHMRTLAGLCEIGQAFESADVPWLTFKGPVLSEIVYSRPDLRSYGDLDVLVHPHDVPAAVEALQAVGYRLLEGEAPSSNGTELGQLHMRNDLGGFVDVHWHLVNRPEMRASVSVPTAQVMGRRRLVSIDGVPAWTLDGVDTLLHLCVHAGMAGGCRLLWLKDVERAAARSLPWELALDRASEWRASQLVGTVLMRASATLDAHVPDDAVRSLTSRAGRSVSALVDRRWPPHQWSGGRSAAVMWCRFTRDSVTQTIVLIARRIWWAVSRRFRDAVLRLRGRWSSRR